MLLYRFKATVEAIAPFYLPCVSEAKPLDLSHLKREDESSAITLDWKSRVIKVVASERFGLDTHPQTRLRQLEVAPQAFDLCQYLH